MGSITGQDKATLDKTWANAEARLKLNKTDRMLWAELGHTVRPHVYFDKILVAWTLVKGQPQIKDIFTVSALDGSFHDGLWIKVKGKVSGVETIITHTPQRLAPELDVFAWVPFFNEVRFVSGDWNNYGAPRSLRLAVCLKMACDHRDDRLREGVDHISELHVFRDAFPQYASTRF